MKLLLSEEFPLRTTRDLGNYVEDIVLPIRYGDLTSARFNLIRLDGDRFFAADHPMEITAVFVDGVEVSGWSRVLRDDGVHTWTEVLLVTPVQEGEDVSATGRGKRRASTGELLLNPADVLEDLGEMAGREEQWSQLRAECSRDGLYVGGSIDRVATVQAWYYEITQSVGAIWCSDVKRLYPVPTAEGLIWPLTSNEMGGLRVTASLEETADELKVAYNHSSAEGRSLNGLSLAASPKRYGGVVVEVDLGWLRSSRAAETVGGRLLARRSSRRYTLEFTTSNIRVRPGQWVSCQGHPLWPFDAPFTAMVTSVVVDRLKNSSAVTAEVVRDAPSISMLGYSAALSLITGSAVDVQFIDGVLFLTLTDDNGRPLVGARVALDGGQVKTSGANGKVQFTASRGTHTLIIEHPSFLSITQTITL